MKKPAPRKSRDLDKVYCRAAFIAKLHRLADALAEGEPFSIQVAGERLHLPAEAVFNIEHERDGGEEELEFQLRWRRPAGAGGGSKRNA
jgi:amphi-Trp domain-containing protein